MANLSQSQKQQQKQTQKMSQVQIQAVSILAMNSDDIRNEIYKAVNDNPALEIVKDNRRKDYAQKHTSSVDNQQALEATEDRTETLQSHLMHQLNSMNLSFDEMELSQKLIYNLDRNGFYGSMLAPESLLDKSRVLQTKEMLTKCIKRIQGMDPVGTCCRTPEESLLVQAQQRDDSPKLALFILDGHIELLNPPEASAVYKKLRAFQKEWHQKTFANEILLDKLTYDEEDVAEAISFILSLNLHPAQDYLKDTNSQYESPDVVLNVKKIPGKIAENDYSKGIVTADSHSYFQIEYASGVLPELRISQDFSLDKDSYQKAKIFLDVLAFRESSLVLQGCAIVNAQKDFFNFGPEALKSITRRQIAAELGIHESTVSRISSRKNSKYIQTQWGLFPFSYFFTSGVKSKNGNAKISSEVIKQKILELLSTEEDLSDLKLAEALNREGIKIARRTVTKYRQQMGMSNLYKR